MMASTSLFTSCKDYSDDINDLQSQIDALDKDLASKYSTLQAALDQANAQIAAAQTAIAAAQSAADAAQTTANKALVDAAAAMSAAQANAASIEAAMKLITDLQNNKVDQSVYDAKMTEIDAAISTLKGDLANATTAIAAINTQIDALNKFMEAIEALDLTTEFPALKEQVATLVTELASLKASVDTNTTDIATNTSAIAALKTELTTLSTEVDKINSSLNTLVSLLSKRLTSMLFAPTAYINGIPVINFATLEYTAWGDDLLSDEPAGTTSVSISSSSTTASYYVSPSSVATSNINDLVYINQSATNTITRSGSEAVITVSEFSITDGKLKVNLKKSSTEPFTSTTSTDGTTTTEGFMVVALQAGIALTEAEEAAGVSPVVTSDWVRLAETSGTPKIHNIASTDASDADYYFYNYTTLVGGTDAPTTTVEANAYVVDSLDYTATLDLTTLADVLVGTTEIIAKDYGLAFTFNLVDFTIKDSEGTDENQSSFASITDNVISALQGQKAIGHMPLVQAVLKDTVNNNVVDVRYFLIKWISSDAVDNLGNLDTFTFDFGPDSCSVTYSDSITKTIFTNDIIAATGLDLASFNKIYSLSSSVYSTEADAAAAKDAVTTLGTLKIDSLAPSITWEFPVSAMPITQAEYEAGVATRTVWGRIDGKSSESNGQSYVFSLTMTLDLEKMELSSSYNQGYWNVSGSDLVNTNASKIFKVNNSLTSDATYGDKEFAATQMIGSFLKGYIGTITSPSDLISASKTSLATTTTTTSSISGKFVFDSIRVASQLGSDWTVSTDGTKISYKDVVGATISDLGVIQLYEDPAASSSVIGTPTSAALYILNNGINLPVNLVGEYCNGSNEEDTVSATLDQFMVAFIPPLTMTVDANADLTFVDGVIGGDTLEVANYVTITTAFGPATVVCNGPITTTQTALEKWFNVEGIVWSLADAKTNMINGGADPTITSSTDLSDWADWSTMSPDYKLTAVTVTSTSGIESTNAIVFENASGVALQKVFKVAIPVYATTKWNTQLYDKTNEYVIFTISPASQATTRRK